jgi:alpha-beta hydrolase superfamily lysophospholipase
MKKLLTSLTVLVFLLAGSTCVYAGGSEPEPPGQPAAGYGSSADYISPAIDYHDAITIGDKEDGTRTWVFVPQNLKNGSTAPVVIYLHGFMVPVPPVYQGQIDHLVKQGIIVIFPQFNLNGFDGIFNDTDQYQMLDRAVQSVDAALALPEVNAVAEMDNITLAGHSLGGLLGLCWTAGGGVDVKNMVLQHPNISLEAIPGFVRDLFLGDMVTLDYETMAPETTCPVILVGGEDDTIAKPEHVQAAYNSLTSTSTKVYYEFKTDEHGDPDLDSDHMAACQDDGAIPGWLLDLMGGMMGFGAMEEDAIDYRVEYASVDAAVDDQTRVSFDMGQWSDGTPVTPVELIVEQ